MHPVANHELRDARIGDFRCQARRDQLAWAHN
jgi:hypothetical protein